LQASSYTLPRHPLLPWATLPAPPSANMGLLKLLRGLKKSETELRILMLGLDNAGKTTILKSLASESIDNIAPTQGFNIKSLSQSGFKLNVWDIGGQRAIREYWSNYYEASDALVYVIDSSDEGRVREADEQFAELLQDETLGNIPVLIFANKQDIGEALSPEEIEASLAQSSGFLAGRYHTYQACSAVTGEGLEDGMGWLITTVSDAHAAAAAEA